MKLVIAVVQDKDVQRLMNRLVEKGFQATRQASTGGFLREGNTTVMLGVEEDDVDVVLSTIRDNCKARQQMVTPLASLAGAMDSYMPYPVEVTVGGAVIFILPVERFERF